MTTTDATPTPAPIPIPAPSPTPLNNNLSASNRYTYKLSDISYRRATRSDYELLKRYRIECGWGLERMEKDLRDEGGKGDTPLWIFSVPASVASKSVASKSPQGWKGGEQEQEKEDVGMGGLVLHAEGQRYMADRTSRTVKLCEFLSCSSFSCSPCDEYEISTLCYVFTFCVMSSGPPSAFLFLRSRGGESRLNFYFTPRFPPFNFDFFQFRSDPPPRFIPSSRKQKQPPST